MEHLEPRCVPAALAGFAVGSGPGDTALAALYDAEGTEQLVVDAFPGFGGGVSAAAADLTGDDLFDLIVGAGPGGGPHVKVFDGLTGAELFSFFAFDSLFTGGVDVAAGDVTGDGRDDLIVGAGPSGGPHVKAFDGITGAEVWSLFAFDPLFTGGVDVAAGDVTGDGQDDLIVGAGPGGGPHVRAFDSAGQVVASFFAYDAAFTGGVSVAAGDIHGDGQEEILTGAGPGGGPHVQVFDGNGSDVHQSFFAFDPAFQGGVEVGAGDADADSAADVVAVSGQGGGGHVQTFDGQSAATLHSFVAPQSVVPEVPGDGLTATPALVTALTTRRYWISYEPTAPDGTYTCAPTEASVKADLTLLRQAGFQGLVTYTMVGSYSKIPRWAKEVGFTWVIAGAYWLRPTAPAQCGIAKPYASELANITNPANLKGTINSKQVQFVDGFMVGNEGLADNRYQLGDLKSYVAALRQNAATKALPLTTSEPAGQYLGGNNAATLLNNTVNGRNWDWIFPNLDYFCWNHALIGPAAMWNEVAFGYNAVVAAAKKSSPGVRTVVHESWYATNNAFKLNQDPLATEANQVAYHKLMASGKNQQFPITGPFYFVWGEAFDQPWKKTGAPSCNPTQQPEPYYGFFKSLPEGRAAKQIVKDTQLKNLWTSGSYA